MIKHRNNTLEDRVSWPRNDFGFIFLKIHDKVINKQKTPKGRYNPPEKAFPKRIPTIRKITIRTAGYLEKGKVYDPFSYIFVRLPSDIFLTKFVNLFFSYIYYLYK